MSGTARAPKRSQETTHCGHLASGHLWILPGVYHLNGRAGQNGLVKRPLQSPDRRWRTVYTHNNPTMHGGAFRQGSENLFFRQLSGLRIRIRVRTGARIILSPLDRSIPPNNIWNGIHTRSIRGGRRTSLPISAYPAACSFKRIALRQTRLVWSQNDDDPVRSSLFSCWRGTLSGHRA